MSSGTTSRRGTLAELNARRRRSSGVAQNPSPGVTGDSPSSANSSTSISLFGGRASLGGSFGPISISPKSAPVLNISGSPSIERCSPSTSPRRRARTLREFIDIQIKDSKPVELAVRALPENVLIRSSVSIENNIHQQPPASPVPSKAESSELPSKSIEPSPILTVTKDDTFARSARSNSQARMSLRMPLNAFPVSRRATMA